jgi:hypothetical protein
MRYMNFFSPETLLDLIQSSLLATHNKILLTIQFFNVTLTNYPLPKLDLPKGANSSVL